MTKIFVTARLIEADRQLLEQHAELEYGGWGYEGRKLTTDELIERAQGADVLVVEYEDVDGKVLDGLPTVKYVCCTRGGMESIDVPAVIERGVALSNTPGRNAVAVAELTVGLMLAVARFIPQTHHYIVSQDWERAVWDIAGNTPVKRYAGLELQGATVGMLGYGAIAQQVAQRLSGFGVSLRVYDPYYRGDDVTTEDLEAVLAASDFVSLHCKLTPETESIINSRSLDMMKPTAYLVNTARGALVDEDALVEALQQKRIAGAALDVLREEPIDPTHPLLQLENVVLTPHIGGASTGILRHQSAMATTDVLNFMRARELVHAVV